MTAAILETLMGRKEKVACKNCGEPTTFDSNAHYQRVKLGWCGPCFQQSSRATVDEETAMKRWWDDEKVSTDWTGFNPPGRR
jgi:hypothetical protein